MAEREQRPARAVGDHLRLRPPRRARPATTGCSPSAPTRTPTCARPSRSPSAVAPGDEALNALIELSADADAKVRDWATFALGTLAEADSPALRDALAARLDDADEDTRMEAVHGLALRGDERAEAPARDLLADRDHVRRRRLAAPPARRDGRAPRQLNELGRRGGRPRADDGWAWGMSSGLPGGRRGRDRPAALAHRGRLGRGAGAVGSAGAGAGSTGAGAGASVTVAHGRRGRRPRAREPQRRRPRRSLERRGPPQPAGGAGASGAGVTSGAGGVVGRLRASGAAGRSVPGAGVRRAAPSIGGGGGRVVLDRGLLDRGLDRRRLLDDRLIGDRRRVGTGRPSGTPSPLRSSIPSGVPSPSESALERVAAVGLLDRVRTRRRRRSRRCRRSTPSPLVSSAVAPLRDAELGLGVMAVARTVFASGCDGLLP